MTDRRPLIMIAAFAIALAAFTTALSSLADNGGALMQQTHATPEMIAAHPALF